MKDERLSSVGKRIKELRKSKGMSLQDVAERSDVTAGLLSKIENFRTIPSLPVLLNISRALEVNMSELVRTVVEEEEDIFVLVPAGKGGREREGDTELELILDREISRMGVNVQELHLPAGAVYVEEEAGAALLMRAMLGPLEVRFRQEVLTLDAGDTLWLDAGLTYTVINPGSRAGRLFQVRLLAK